MEVPASVKNKLCELCELCESHPEHIPLPEVAKFLHAKPSGIRNSINNGQCPFGFGWKLGANNAYQIPTTKFYLWYTNSGINIQWGKEGTV